MTDKDVAAAKGQHKEPLNQLANHHRNEDEERGAKTDAYVAGLAIDATKGAVSHHKEKKAQRKNRGPDADAMIVSAGVKATEAATKKVVNHHQNHKNSKVQLIISS